jgi:glucose dehydrogenase
VAAGDARGSLIIVETRRAARSARNRRRLDSYGLAPTEPEYSPLDQITRQLQHALTVAWTVDVALTRDFVKRIGSTINPPSVGDRS